MNRGLLMCLASVSLASSLNTQSRNQRGFGQAGPTPSTLQQSRRPTITNILQQARLPTKRPSPKQSWHPVTGILSVDDFLSNFNKTYTDEAEKKKRIEILKLNYKAMEEHNKLYESGKSSYKMGVNEYSDTTYAEIIAKHIGIHSANITGRHKRSADLYVPPRRPRPIDMDYRNKGAVNPIRNQGGCSSSWAFSIISSIESIIYQKIGLLTQLSEQDLVDCSHIPGRLEGCQGGWPEDAITYVIDNGISYRDEYPYNDGEETCKNTAPKSYDVISYKKVRPGNEDDLLDALVNVGPISICIYTTNSFKHYQSGVYFERECANGDNPVNHCMTVVGYGTENGIEDYWLLRNSWGRSWGEEGYIKMARNRNKHCLISSHAVIPVIQDSCRYSCNSRFKNENNWKNLPLP